MMNVHISYSTVSFAFDIIVIIASCANFLAFHRIGRPANGRISQKKRKQEFSTHSQRSYFLPYGSPEFFSASLFVARCLNRRLSKSIICNGLRAHTIHTFDRQSPFVEIQTKQREIFNENWEVRKKKWERRRLRMQFTLAVSHTHRHTQYKVAGGLCLICDTWAHGLFRRWMIWQRCIHPNCLRLLIC